MLSRSLRLFICVCALAAAAVMARAGELFGTLSEGDKPLPAGVKVEVSAGDKTYTVETDKFGGYRVYVKEKGKCTLKVLYKGQSPSREVMSFEKSTRYDLILEQKDGSYALRRK